MDIPKLNRGHAVALMFGGTLFVLVLSVVGAVVMLVAQPATSVLETYANPLVSVSVAFLNLASCGIALAVLTWAVTTASSRPGSIWGPNVEVLSAARLVGAVYLALIVANWVISEVRSFVQVQVGNATQVDMFSGVGLVLVTVGLPIFGAILVLVVAPGVLDRFRRRAV